jgi:Domain of unknown function(DUF2779)
MAFRQCPRRLWLEIHHPNLRENSAATEVKFAVGDLVGELARYLYDPEENGALIKVMEEGPDLGVQRTQALLDKRVPIFEAGFEGAGARAFVDILKPSKKSGTRTWELIEVKSSTSLKGSHRDDVAIQAYVAHQAKLNLSAVKVAHIDTSFTYKGNDQYEGLLKEVDLTDEALSRFNEVAGWVSEAHEIAASNEMPHCLTGAQCRSPNPCGFIHYCRTQEAPIAFPVDLLPRVQGELRRWMQLNQIRELKDIPDEKLTLVQQRVKTCTLNNTRFFDREGAQKDIQSAPLPHSFLDFEAVQLAVPIWPGTHPYQMFPFQFSLHIRDAEGGLTHHEFMDLTGKEPSRAFAEALVQACPSEGAIFVWNASFELTRLAVLGQQFVDLKPALMHIQSRIVDLLKIVELRYYHPGQRGSWKLKRVLPTLAPGLNHQNLNGVKDGYMAVLAYVEAIQPETTPERRAEIQHELFNYCRLDSLALVTILDAMVSIKELEPSISD